MACHIIRHVMVKNDIYSFRIPWLHLVIAFVHLYIQHVRENKGHLLIRNTLLTSGDCFCTFIRHVRDNKGQLYTHSEYPGWLLLYAMWGKTKDIYSFGIPWLHLVHAVRDNKGQLYTHSEYPGWLSFIRHVRENKGHLLIRNTQITPGDYFCTFIYTACEGK